MIVSNLVKILFLTSTVPDLLKDNLKSIAKKENYISCEVESRSVDTNGASHLGEIYKVNIRGEAVDGEKQTNLFVKKILQDDKIPNYLNLNSAYESELFVYKRLSKIFSDLQNEFNVPLEERFKLVRGFEESGKDYIILDNLSKKGYTTYHRMDLVSLRFAELSVQELAKFHALSFVIQKQMPQYFESNIKTIEDPFSWNDGADNATEHLMKITVHNIKDEYIKNKAEAFISAGLSKLAQYNNNNMTAFLCLCHGDYKPTNIMKKENNEEVVEVLPIDFQLMHYGCPVMDLVFFLFLGTDRAFRSHHLSNLKDLYYTTLVNFSSHFHVNMEKTVPRKMFEDTFRERLDYGLIAAMELYPNHFASDFALANENTDGSIVKLDDRFQNRFKGVIEDFIEWGYL